MRDLDNKTFNEAISGEKTVIVDFWADWCMPCKLLAPVVAEIADEFGEKAEFCKLNVDENPALAAKYGIDSIPTLIFFRMGEEIERSVGLKQKEQLKREIEACL